jgi:signal peptidase I
MTDDDQGLREPATATGDARYGASGNGRRGARHGTRPLIGGDPSGNDAPNGGRGSERKRQSSFWKELPILIGVALALALIIKAFAVQAFYIPSQSMENTLEVGDRVLVNKIVYHTREIRRGDVVVFNGLDSWDPEVQYSAPKNPVSRVLHGIGSAFGVVPGEKDYIKRVIGIPGDRVACCDSRGRVTVNGHPLNETSYLYVDPSTGDQNRPSDVRFKVTVPPGHLWVMGDHREVSYDSRGHLGDPGGGSIPESRVIGRAFVIVWPVGRIATLPIPGTFGQHGLALANDLVPATPVALGFVGALPLTLWHRRRRRATA